MFLEKCSSGLDYIDWIVFGDVDH